MTFFYQITIKHEWSTGAIWNPPARESSSEWWMVWKIRRRDERETLNDMISLFIVIELGGAQRQCRRRKLEWCLIDGENIAKWVFKHQKLWIIKWATVGLLGSLSMAPASLGEPRRSLRRENHGRKYLTINFDGNLGVWLPRRHSDLPARVTSLQKRVCLVDVFTVATETNVSALTHLLLCERRNSTESRRWNPIRCVSLIKYRKSWHCSLSRWAGNVGREWGMEEALCRKTNIVKLCSFRLQIYWACLMLIIPS